MRHRRGAGARAGSSDRLDECTDLAQLLLERRAVERLEQVVVGARREGAADLDGIVFRRAVDDEGPLSRMSLRGAPKGSPMRLPPACSHRAEPDPAAPPRSARSTPPRRSPPRRRRCACCQAARARPCGRRWSFRSAGISACDTPLPRAALRPASLRAPDAAADNARSLVNGGLPRLRRGRRGQCRSRREQDVGAVPQDLEAQPGGAGEPPRVVGLDRHGIELRGLLPLTKSVRYCGGRAAVPRQRMRSSACSGCRRAPPRSRRRAAARSRRWRPGSAAA